MTAPHLPRSSPSAYYPHMDLTPEGFRRSSRENEDGCWEWQRGKDKRRYGKVLFRGRQDNAHRVSFILSRGEIPPGMWVLHHCDNPQCIRPDHLWLGTRMDNIRGMISKGRDALTGDRCAAAKLCGDDVKTIRTMFAAGSTPGELGRTFGVTTDNVYLIVNRKTWRHI